MEECQEAVEDLQETVGDLQGEAEDPQEEEIQEPIWTHQTSHNPPIAS